MTTESIGTKHIIILKRITYKVSTVKKDRLHIESLGRSVILGNLQIDTLNCAVESVATVNFGWLHDKIKQNIVVKFQTNSPNFTRSFTM